MKKFFSIYLLSFLFISQTVLADGLNQKHLEPQRLNQNKLENNSVADAKSQALPNLKSQSPEAMIAGMKDLMILQLQHEYTKDLTPEQQLQLDQMIRSALGKNPLNNSPEDINNIMNSVLVDFMKK